jgi:hypothetical protein
MMWPFVSRRGYDEACAAIRRLEENVQYERAVAQAASARFDTLLGMYHELKLQGASTPPAPLAPMPRPERDDVFDAIELQAGNDPTLKRHLTRWARTKKLEGINPTDIINAVLHWEQDDSDTAIDPGVNIVQ